MISARKLIRCLDEFWPVLETLALRSQHHTFSFQDVQSLVQRYAAQQTSEQCFKDVQRLLQLEILIPMAKSSQLELNRAVLEFLQFLTQELTLGTVGDIESRILELNRLREKMTQAAAQKDTTELRRFVRLMDERVREVVKHFRKNELAIKHLVEQAKADDRQMSLAKRYASVMDAFDEYIEPVLQMIDINGPFQKSIEALEHALSDQISFIEDTGFMGNDKEPLIQLRTRLLEMNQIGRESLIRSTDQLMPLREELRKNTLVSRNASELLARLRKQGLEPLLDGLVPKFSSDLQKFSLGSANQITSYMAELTEYEDERYQLPDAIDQTPSSNIRVPDVQDVLKSARSTAKKTDLSRWLADSYPQLPVDELLFLYQELSRAPALQLEHATDTTELEIHGYRLKLHPFINSGADRK
ncbi:MAG TPA: hypothetical protein DCS87_03310 [Rheinheimera sp.]|nr:hypothetical protein [Rheinheimera sp.]